MNSEDILIREFRSSDYSHIVRLEEKAFPDIAVNEDSLKFDDKNRSGKCEHQRYIMERDGETIGHGFYDQRDSGYNPRKFFIYGTIHTDHQGRGYGAKLYRHILDELDRSESVKLVCHTREDKKRAVRFIEDRAFKETMRVWELELDVDSFNFEKYQGLKKDLREKGIVLTSIDELGMDDENKKKLYRLYEDVVKDVPISDEHTGIRSHRFLEFFQHPYFIPETYIIAVKDDQFIGLSNNWFLEEQNALFIGMTGVKKEFRGKSIATAVKVKAIETASEKDITMIKTENDTVNKNMLHINEKMGFHKKSAWIHYEKPF